jgi:hypothetical protein
MKLDLKAAGFSRRERLRIWWYGRVWKFQDKWGR